jgi:hypothetical protein
VVARVLLDVRWRCGRVSWLAAARWKHPGLRSPTVGPSSAEAGKLADLAGARLPGLGAAEPRANARHRVVGLATCRT